MRAGLRLIAVLAVVVLAAPVRPARADIVDRLDQKAADVACGRWWNGAPPKLAKLRGRVVMVHVSDPKKITSKAFEAKVKEIHAKNADRPFTLIEIVLATEADAESYVGRNGATWSVGVDAEGAVGRAYPGSSVPRTYLIGPDGLVAFHAHVAALTPEVLEAQFARVRFFDTKSVPRKSKKAAKAAAELRFGTAVQEADRLLADKYSTDEDKALAEIIKQEVARYHAFQMKVFETLRKDLDWAVAYRRVERMRKIYKGTEFEESVEEVWNKLEANPRVAYVVKAQNLLDRILEKSTKKKRDLEAMLNELRLFAGDYENTAPAEKAQHWIKEFERQLSEMEK